MTGWLEFLLAVALIAGALWGIMRDCDEHLAAVDHRDVLDELWADEAAHEEGRTLQLVNAGSSPAASWCAVCDSQGCEHCPGVEAS